MLGPNLFFGPNLSLVRIVVELKHLFPAETKKCSKSHSNFIERYGVLSRCTGINSGVNLPSKACASFTNWCPFKATFLSNEWCFLMKYLTSRAFLSNVRFRPAYLELEFDVPSFCIFSGTPPPPGLTSMAKHDDHAMTWCDYGDAYSLWYDHGNIMAWRPCFPIRAVR